MINDKKTLDRAVYNYDADGEFRDFEFRSPLCINTFRFDLYRDWTIDRILVFEAFIIFSFKFGNEFYKTMKHLEEDLRLTPYSIRKHRDFLIDQGYIKKEKGSEFNNFKNTYKVIYDKIIEDIDKIYKFELITDDNGAVKELYTRMFQSYMGRTHPDNRSYYPGRYLFQASGSGN